MASTSRTPKASPFPSNLYSGLVVKDFPEDPLWPSQAGGTLRRDLRQLLNLLHHPCRWMDGIHNDGAPPVSKKSQWTNYHVSGWNTVFASWTLITIPWKIHVWRSWTPLGYACFLIWCHLSLCLVAVFCCKAVALEAPNHLGLILLDTIVQASNLLRPIMQSFKKTEAPWRLNACVFWN